MVDFLEWLKAIFKQWVAEVTGGVLICMLALYSELSGFTVSPRIYEVVVLFALLQAMFLAWREKHQEGLTLMLLRKSAQFGLGLTRMSLMADPPHDHSVIQLELGVKNHLPNNALRYKVESEVLTVEGNRVEGSELSTSWHGLGALSELSFLGQRFRYVSFGSRTEGTVEYSILYGMAGDSVNYRMMRRIALMFTQQSGTTPTLQRWVVLSESDVLVA